MFVFLGWTIEEDEYVCVHAVNLPFLDSNSMISPNSELNDGCLYLLIVRKGATKMDLLKIMMTMEQGLHIYNNTTEMIRVRAVRIEPLTNDGHITVDGELVDHGMVQAAVIPNTCQVMLRNQAFPEQEQ